MDPKPVRKSSLDLRRAAKIVEAAAGAQGFRFMPPKLRIAAARIADALADLSERVDKVGEALEGLP